MGPANTMSRAEVWRGRVPLNEGYLVKEQSPLNIKGDCLGLSLSGID